MITYNTNEWKFNAANPASFGGNWADSQYTILEYSSEYIGAYICQPVLFGLMKFEDFILMTANYNDYPESKLSGAAFDAFATSIQTKLDPVGYNFREETKEVVSGCCWSSCY